MMLTDFYRDEHPAGKDGTRLDVTAYYETVYQSEGRAFLTDYYKGEQSTGKAKTRLDITDYYETTYQRGGRS